MSRSLADRLHAAAPPPSAVQLPVKETISDIERILKLPRRPPVDCERDPVTRQYKPETQALIDQITAKFSRGPRLSCACRERKLRLTPEGHLIIARVLPEDEVPEPPIITTAAAFVADLQRHNAAEQAAAQAVMAMQPGSEITLPSADVRGHACIKQLNAVQAWFLRDAEECGGAVGFCGVGSGKSIAFLLSSLLYADARLAVLLIEPKQRAHYRAEYLRLREHFRVSSIVFDDGKPGYTVPGTTPLHLISYSVVSQTRNSDILDNRDPDVLGLDEAHRACGQSAINRRVKRFCMDKIKRREEALQRGEPVRARAVNLLDASGTLESKSVEDTQMLCAYSLGTGSPLPLDPIESARWSAVMDRSYQPDRNSKTAKMLQKVFTGNTYDGDSLDNLLSDGPEAKIREGFRQHRLWTPGIISSSAASVNAAIYLSERIPPKMPQSVRDALINVRSKWQRPDGEELTEKIEQVSCARNVGCGFYSYWAFPKHKCECTDYVPCQACQLIDNWFLRRKMFNKEARSKLLLGEQNLDSRKLLEDAARRFHQKDPPYQGELPVWASLTWPAWAEIEDAIEYDERQKWIDNGGDWLARDAAEWATKNKGVVWFQSIAFGRKVAELTGLPYFNGGPGAEDRMRAEKGDRSIIVSINAHGAGTNGLQFVFNHQLICETPASNASQKGYEQLLGRLHREGQKKDAVITEGYFHITELKDALRKAIEQAEFNFEMTGNKQKLLCADIDVEDI